MKDGKDIVAKNISELRVAAGLTQLAFAEALNYSDKAVSKWERAESVPDVFTLKRIADLFGVSVDYLLESKHTVAREPRVISEKKKRQHRYIRAISFFSVWLLAVIYFVVHLIFLPEARIGAWHSFIYAIPVSATVELVLSSLWGSRKFKFAVISVLIWGIILSVHLTLLATLSVNIWLIYILGAPAEAVVLLVAGLTREKNGGGAGES